MSTFSDLDRKVCKNVLLSNADTHTPDERTRGGLEMKNDPFLNGETNRGMISLPSLFFVLLNPIRARFGYTNCLVPYAAIHSYMGHSYWFSRVLKSSHCERSVPLVENGTSSSFPV